MLAKNLHNPLKNDENDPSDSAASGTPDDSFLF
jgi:hypothetical protein